jgi:hypothetical protein
MYPLGGGVGKMCRDPGSNRGPLDLQSNALPTELSRRVHRWSDRTFILISSLAWDFLFQHIKNLCCVAHTNDVVKLILVDFERLRSGTVVCLGGAMPENRLAYLWI